MRIITNLDQGANVSLTQYELFTVEIAYNPTTGVHLSGPSFQKEQNAIVISEAYYPDNPSLIGSPGKKVYLMMATAPLVSSLYWFFSRSSYVADFNFELAVLPHN
ncbi:hypothetical protein [Syntrophomonas curvata]